MSQNLILSWNSVNWSTSHQRHFSELIVSDSVDSVQFSARKKAARLLLQSQLKTALSRSNYEEVISLFLDNVSENINSELADSFVSNSP